jgi:ubiquinone/menaquinone biosynthesis C-methylase UbiE
VAGIEISDGMVAQAGRRLARRGRDRVELQRGDPRQLPFEDESFDLVVNGYMLDLLPRDEIPRALGEFRRVLRPSGRLVRVRSRRRRRLRLGVARKRAGARRAAQAPVHSGLSIQDAQAVQRGSAAVPSTKSLNERRL